MNKSIKQPIGQPWSISKIWDEVFDKAPDQIIPRDYLYASEIGSSFLDVYYKMQGIQPTNYPTSVNRMKMEAGKVFEGIVRMVLKRAGIMVSAQQKIDFNLKDLLSVHGKLDFIGGGEINPEQIAQTSIGLKMLWEELDMPQIYIDIADRTLGWVNEISESGVRYLEVMPLELKSVSAYVWKMVEDLGKPTAYHTDQCFHYTHGLKLPKGRVIYISREDTRIKEYDVLNDAENLKHYKDWITKMTDYWVNQEEPIKENLILFGNDFKFRKNTMGVEWSRYLTMAYGYKSPQEFRDHVEKPAQQFNRVFERCVNNKKMTDKNWDVIREAKVFFPEWDDLVSKAKAQGVQLEEVID